MTTLLADVLAQPAWAVYGVVALVVLLEGAVMAGFVLPGETVAVLGGVSVALGRTDLLPMVVVVLVSAVVGDTIGFLLGRALGPRLLRHRLLVRRQEHVDRLRDGLVGRAPATVALARWTAVVRSFVPALAGASGMPYRTFARWNLVGALGWAGVSVGLGAAAGRSGADVQEWMGTGSALVLGLVLAVVGALALHRRHRRRVSQVAEGVGQGGSVPALGEAAGSSVWKRVPRATSTTAVARLSLIDVVPLGSWARTRRAWAAPLGP